MNESVTNIKQKSTEYWEAMPPKNKKIAIGSAIAVLVVAVLIVYFLYKDDMVPLYSGMSAEESGEVTAILDSWGTEYEVTQDGTIMVPEAEEPEIRMDLATEGYPKEALTYETYSNSLDWASTDFEQRTAWTMQLQERLQDTIETLDGIESAIVTLNVPEDNSYALSEDESTASASVVLGLAPGVELTSEEITGIQELVVKSVPGLTSENVAIVDQTGKQLNPVASEGQSDTDAASSQLELEEYAADQVEQNILELFIPIFGEDGVKVACDIEIDFSQTITQEDTYTPVVGDEGIPDSSSETYQGSAENANGGVPGTESNSGSGTDTYENPDGSTSGETISTTEQIDYLVNHMSEYTESDQGVIENITISVLIDQESITPEEQETYVSLAANAAGVPEEAVVVEAVPFTAENEAEEETQQQILVNQITQTFKGIGKIVFILILVKLIISGIKKIFGKQPEDEFELDEDDLVDEALEQARRDKIAQELEEAAENELAKGDFAKRFEESAAENEQRNQIIDLTDENPAIVAQVVKSWLRGDEK